MSWLSVPNLFTLARLAMVPWIVQSITAGADFRAGWLLGAAALTDIVDGALARRFAWKTRAGAYLDPIADKILLSAVYIALAMAGHLPWWLVGLVLGRDLLILAAAGAALAFTNLRNFPPSVWGKASTFAQIMTAVAFMARNALRWRSLEWLAPLMMWPAAALTLWSGADYAWRGMKMLRAAGTTRIDGSFPAE